MSDLYQELQEKMRQIDMALSNLPTYGRQKAETERDYKVLLCTEALRLRDEGMPVGLISIVVYGLPEVANARQKRDIAQTIYETEQEVINSNKLQAKLIESQLQREWRG